MFLCWACDLWERGQTLKLEIKARENGPYLLAGTARYTGADGQERVTTGTSIALCRCGQSGNKPFCDGTHRKVGFKAPAVDLLLGDE
jgi:CDGSH-type Zn-finger protein